MQHLIEKPGPLLDAEGRLAEPGYATSLLLEYQRGAVKANALRIKEWDYYLVITDEHALALTIADNAYMGLVSASLLDFTAPWERTVSRMTLLPCGRTGLPSTSEKGDVLVSAPGYEMAFLHEKGARRLRVRFDEFDKGKALAADIRLTDEPRDSMVIATPFPKKTKAFYYNQKINCMRAEGEVTLGRKTYSFAPERAFGTLDWGRGVWTYRNTWYWGSASGRVGGVPFGFNLGYGFGDTSAATENMIFYDGRAHKLGRVNFGIPTNHGQDEYMRPWHIVSDDGRLSLLFRPVIDRASRTSALVICSDQHQVFGRFTGRAVLDDGQAIDVDGLMGFAEKVMNRW